MHRVSLLSLASFIAPLALAAQQPTAPTAPTAPHDSVRGAIRAVDVRAHTVEVTTGVGLALRVVRLEVPASVPITDRKGGQAEPIQLAQLSASAGWKRVCHDARVDRPRGHVQCCGVSSAPAG